MTIRVLSIDDDAKITGQIYSLLNEEKIGGFTLTIEQADFETGMTKLARVNYDLVIMDLCVGQPTEDSEKMGISTLETLQKHCFSPVIFFTGLPHALSTYQSSLIRVLDKSDGYGRLKIEITSVINDKLIEIKHRIRKYLHESERRFFWDFIQPNSAKLKTFDTELSLGYLLLRNLANSLSKENIKSILDDKKIDPEKSHPLEFYNYPPKSNDEEYEFAEIITKEDKHFIILTPTCDFAVRGKGKRKALFVLLGNCVPLKESPDYAVYSNAQNEKEKNDAAGKLKTIITNSGSDRTFFLPGTPFLEDLYVDFQQKFTIPYDELKDFTRTAKLDSPFAESMLSSFIRYYNRVGFQDIDAKYILERIPKTK